MSINHSKCWWPITCLRCTSKVLQCNPTFISPTKIYLAIAMYPSHTCKSARIILVGCIHHLGFTWTVLSSIVLFRSISFRYHFPPKSTQTFYNLSPNIHQVSKCNALSQEHIMVLKLRTSLDVSAPGHSLWRLYWTCYLQCVMFIFPTGIFYTAVTGFATDCPCEVWFRGLTTCPLCVVQFLEIQFEKIVGL